MVGWGLQEQLCRERDDEKGESNLEETHRVGGGGWWAGLFFLSSPPSVCSPFALHVSETARSGHFRVHVQPRVCSLAIVRARAGRWSLDEQEEPKIFFIGLRERVEASQRMPSSHVRPVNSTRFLAQLLRVMLPIVLLRFRTWKK
jgi:hypothetical protein